jgi:hypothetical protein
MPEYRWVKDTDGVEYAVVASAFDPEIHTALEGDVVLDANGIPTLAKSESGTPAKSALREDWVEYAKTQGMDPGEAEAATKADLIAAYGKEN